LLSLDPHCDPRKGTAGRHGTYLTGHPVTEFTALILPCCAASCMCCVAVRGGGSGKVVPRQVTADGLLYGKRVKDLSQLLNDDELAAEEAAAQGGVPGECLCRGRNHCQVACARLQWTLALTTVVPQHRVPGVFCVVPPTIPARAPHMLCCSTTLAPRRAVTCHSTFLLILHGWHVCVLQCLTICTAQRCVVVTRSSIRVDIEVLYCAPCPMLHLCLCRLLCRQVLASSCGRPVLQQV
jgi:hypothetical protein